jgi:hypothetical protein
MGAAVTEAVAVMAVLATLGTALAVLLTAVRDTVQQRRVELATPERDIQQGLSSFGESTIHAFSCRTRTGNLGAKTRVATQCGNAVETIPMVSRGLATSTTSSL